MVSRSVVSARDNQEIVKQHQAKVYSLAAVGAPPMSVPHPILASSMARSLLFGPYAGFTTVPQARFVHGPAAVDSPEQHRPDDGRRSRQHGPDPLPDQGSDAVHGGSFRQLRGFYPEAKAEDWRLEIAGQRVQIIKKDPKKGGILQFGTELVAAKDGTIAALLGASPGASVTVSIMLDLLELLPEQYRSQAWSSKLQEMFPAREATLQNDAAAYREISQMADKRLGLTY